MALTKGVHHIALKAKGVPAFEKTMHFYTELLGMPVVRTWGSGEDLGAMVAIGGGSPIDCAKAIGVLIAHDADKIKPLLYD